MNCQLGKSTGGNGNHAFQRSQRVQKKLFVICIIIHKCQLHPILPPCVSCRFGFGFCFSHPLDYPFPGFILGSGFSRIYLLFCKYT